MHEIKIGDAAAALGVSVDTVRRLAAAGTVKARRSRGGQRLIEGRSIAQYLVKRNRAGGPASTSRQSVRNHMQGIITRVTAGKVAAQVEIQAGPYRLVSLLTREAVDSLGLKPGMMAIASVKATNVAVELPASPSRAKRG